MAEATLVSLEDCYFVRYKGEESQAEEYGQPLDYTFRDGRRMIALVECRPRADDIESALGDEWGYWVSGAVDMDVVTEDEDEEEGEGSEIDIEEEEPERQEVSSK